MRIRFLTDQIYENAGVGKGPKFPAGHVLDTTGVAAALALKNEPTEAWAEAFLHRWVQRGAAELVDSRSPVSEPDPLDHDANGVKGGAAPPVNQPLGTEKRGEPTLGLDDDKQVEKIDLSTLSRAELDALAEKRKVDISDAKNKGDVIAALELAEETGENA